MTLTKERIEEALAQTNKEIEICKISGGVYLNDLPIKTTVKQALELALATLEPRKDPLTQDCY